MEKSLFDSERKVMEVLWREGPVTARRVSDVLGEETGWNINTTYTVIKRCIQKGLIRRQDPKFLCIPLITREDAQNAATDELIDRVYGGCADKLFASLLGRNKLTAEQLQRLRQMVEEMK